MSEEYVVVLGRKWGIEILKALKGGSKTLNELINITGGCAGTVRKRVLELLKCGLIEEVEVRRSSAKGFRLTRTGWEVLKVIMELEEVIGA